MNAKILLCCVMLICSTSVPALNVAAATEPVQETYILDIGQGITMETTTTVYSSLTRANTARATRESVYKNNGAVIATVTLDATFSYDGSSAKVTNASVSKSIESGWTYSSEKLSTSGSTARVTATLTKYSGAIAIGTVGVDISLTCSKDGKIS